MYVTKSVINKPGMWYARRINDDKEFLACSMTRQGGIKGVSSDGEITTLLKGTYEFYKR